MSRLLIRSTVAIGHLLVENNGKSVSSVGKWSPKVSLCNRRLNTNTIRKCTTHVDRGTEEPEMVNGYPTKCIKCGGAVEAGVFSGSDRSGFQLGLGKSVCTKCFIRYSRSYLRWECYLPRKNSSGEWDRCDGRVAGPDFKCPEDHSTEPSEWRYGQIFNTDNCTSVLQLKIYDDKECPTKPEKRRGVTYITGSGV